MYQEKLFHSFLSKSRIAFKDEYGNVLPLTEEVGDWATPIISHQPFTPDFFIRGFYHKINKSLSHEFIIHKDGPQVIFITGIPIKHIPLDPFRFKNRLFSSYFEDQVKGIFFQVLDVSETYIGESKQLGIQQFKLD